MAAFADGLGLSEDEGCLRWAHGVAGLEHAPGLDPVVGSVNGIGPALFAYLRMRSGADALKPDLRVARALRKRHPRFGRLTDSARKRPARPRRR